MDSADHSHESHRSFQYTDAQDHHCFSGPTGYYNNAKTGDANSRRTMLSGESTRSSSPSRTSFASASTMANTASTSRTSMGSSSSAHPTASGDTRQETDVAAASIQSDAATAKTAMYCVCCWEPKQELAKHYPRCPYIKGDWAFWACPYTFDSLHDREAFINHIKSFKPDEKRIAGKTEYVTARDWAIQFSEDAKKRQLVNTVFAYFNANPGLIEEWKALNKGELVPNLNNVADVGIILTNSSILRRRSPLGPAQSVKEVSIDQLLQVFEAGTKAGANTQTQSEVSSRKRQRINTPVLYTALEIVNKDVRVSIGDAHFDSAELAERQQQQLDGQSQERFLCFGGVVHSPSGTEALAPTKTPPTAHTPSTSENQTQGAGIVPNNVSSNPARVQYGLQNDLMNHGGFELPPPVPQTLQPTQSANVLAGANHPPSASADDYLDDDLDPAFWAELLNDPDFSI